MYRDRFFGADPASADRFRQAIHRVVDELLSSLPDAGTREPYDGELPALADSLNPESRLGLDAVWPELRTIVNRSVPVWDARTAAHLHCPVLVPALAAEVVISALNQSMDSFDQAPAATILERQMIAWLCRTLRLPHTASGTFTAGGTQSNYMGLLLARDHFLDTRWGWNAYRSGIATSHAASLRILCSEAAHFSVEKSAIQLGLGTDAVVKVETDDAFRMDARALHDRVRALRAHGLEPMAIVATAGTTDFGSFDPLPEIAGVAAGESIWLHVDGAYGGAFALSDVHRHWLDGIDRADSVSVDFHKAFFQPISCGAFLLADQSRFRFITVHADYLNPEEHERCAVPDLVNQSVLTTRRFDALKLWTSLRVLGISGFAEMIDRLVALARELARIVVAHPRLAPLHEPTFGCLVFRYVPSRPSADADGVNAAIPAVIFSRRLGVIGHTVVRGRPALKLTLSNPCVEPHELACLVDTVVAVGEELEAAECAVG